MPLLSVDDHTGAHVHRYTQIHTGTHTLTPESTVTHPDDSRGRQGTPEKRFLSIVSGGHLGRV